MGINGIIPLPIPNDKKIGWPWRTDAVAKSPPYLSIHWPKISIITPSFNQGQFIEETIRSVLLQGYPNLEYIIMDGGSTDGTVEIIKQYAPWLAYWVSEPDRGQSHAINKGFEHATGDIVAWLNTDDIYLPGALFHVADEFLRNKPEWIVGITSVTDEKLIELDRFVPQINTGGWKEKKYRSHGWLDFVMTHQSGTALPQPSSFWTRKAILKVGGIDESFRYAMDHDLVGRLAYAGYRPKLIPHTLAYFRVHQQQKTTEFPVIFWKEELSSAKRWLREKLSLQEKWALVGYQIWFSGLIHWERIKKIYILKRTIAFTWNQARTVKRGLKKIKRLLLGDKNPRVPLKGVVPKEVIAKYIPQNPIIIEAGAHIGLDTADLINYFPQGKIYAFEPVPDLFLQLSERVRLYKNVQCYPVALGNQVGEVVMYISSGVSDGSSSILRPKDHLIDHPDVLFDQTIHAPCTTLDEWAKVNKIEKVDLLWLDMQGYELNALKAGLSVLENVRAIYAEVNLKETYEGAPLYSELREWLETRNFKVEVEEIPWEDGGNVLFVRKPSPENTQSQNYE
jgi:FkbM family methyltransferase